MKKNLISPINPREQEDEWKLAHVGLFSSSLISKICGKEGIGKGGLSYIWNKAGENKTGMAAKDDDILTEAIAWGNMNEPYAVKKLRQLFPGTTIREQVFIVDPETKSCSTIDAATITAENATEIFLEPTEIKCPQSYDKYIQMFKFKTPADVKKDRPDIFWQLLDQMLMARSRTGRFLAYQPLFGNADHNIIYFNIDKDGLMGDFKFLSDRKKLALKLFRETREELN
jgi:YqaJ-like viral recombinase domain